MEGARRATGVSPVPPPPSDCFHRSLHLAWPMPTYSRDLECVMVVHLGFLVPAILFLRPSMVLRHIEVMGADLAEINSIVLIAHVDSDAEPAGILKNQMSGNARGDVAFK